MIKTTVVGSYPVPSWLAHSRNQEAFRDAILAVMKTQELAGIDVISDGEISRFDPDHPETNGMIEYFLRPLRGIDLQITRTDIAEFRQGEVGKYRKQPAAIVREPLGEGYLDLPRHWEFIQDFSERPIKFTVTGPHMLSKVVTDRHYLDPPRLAMEFAEILRSQIADVNAPVVQIDEANITGHPDEGKWAAHAINHVLSAVRGEKAVHLCFGNYAGQTIQKGHWKTLLPFVNALQADYLVLECARRSRKELECFRDIRAEMGVGVGVIDVKDNQVETPEDVAGAIEEMAEILGGPERIRYVHPDCGLWVLSRAAADGKLASLVAGRDLYSGCKSSTE